MDFIRYYHNVICDGLLPYFKQEKQSSPCFLCSQRVHGNLVLGNEIYIDAFVFLEKRTKAISSSSRLFLILGTLYWIK